MEYKLGQMVSITIKGEKYLIEIRGDTKRTSEVYGSGFLPAFFRGRAPMGYKIDCPYTAKVSMLSPAENRMEDMF